MTSATTCPWCQKHGGEHSIHCHLADEGAAYCGLCRGSGEGRADGTICGACRGTGEDYGDCDDEPTGEQEELWP